MKPDKISFTTEQLEEVKDDPYKLQELLQNVNYSTYNGETKVLLFAFMYAGNMLERLQEREFKLSPDEQVKLEHLYADIIPNVYNAIDTYQLSDIRSSLGLRYSQLLLPIQRITDPLIKAICTYDRAKMPVSFTMEQLEEVKDDYRGLLFLLQNTKLKRKKDLLSWTLAKRYIHLNLQIVLFYFILSILLFCKERNKSLK